MTWFVRQPQHNKETRSPVLAAVLTGPLLATCSTSSGEQFRSGPVGDLSRWGRSGEQFRLFGREPDLHGDGSTLVLWERWSSGALVHHLSLAGYRNFGKMLDAETSEGHNKDMNFTAIVTYANGRVDRNNGCRTLAHAEAYLKFSASPLVTSVQIINRKGEIVRSAS